MDVVVGHKHNGATEPLIPGEVDDFTDQFFTGDIFGVSLSGYDKLDPATVAVTLNEVTNAFLHRAKNRVARL